MKYYFGALGLPISSQVEISTELYHSIITDTESLNTVGAIEERYDLIVSNYVEYEKAKLDIALDVFTYSDFRIIRYLEYRRALIRLLNNFLSSCRLYFDQNERDFVSKDVPIVVEISKIKEQIYNSCLSYRIAEYLRNSLQHRTMPIKIELNRSFENHFGNKKVEESVIVLLDKEELIIKDNKHIKKILSDLQSIDKSDIDLRDHLSTYIEKISSIHQYIRDEYRDNYLSAKKNIEEALEKYSIIKIPIERQLQRILYIYSEDEENERIHIETVSDSIIRNIEYLQSRNDGNKKFSSVIIHN